MMSPERQEQARKECRLWGHIWQRKITDPMSPNCQHCGVSRGV